MYVASFVRAGGVVVGLAASLALGACTRHATAPKGPAVACLPAGVGVASPVPAAGAASGVVNVYLDGSLSMAGYIEAQTADLRPQGDVLALLDAGVAGRQVRFARFGRSIHPLSAAEAPAFATAAPYRCRGADCDNLESRIDLVLSNIQKGDKSALNVVVTDLWLSSDSVTGSPQVALGTPLAAMLAEGRAVGVLGVRAPYAGPVYDLPGGGAYTGARERPLFLLLIGPEAKVMTFKAAVVESGSPAFTPDRVRYSLFSRAPGSAWRAGASAPLAVSGLGVTSGAAVPDVGLAKIRQYRLNLGKAQAGGGGVAGKFDAEAMVPRGLVWRGPLKASTRVWLLKNDAALKGCRADTWQEYTPLAGAWRPSPSSPGVANFTLNATTGARLTPGRTYLVAAYLGSRALTQPNPAAAWMRAWSFGEGDAAALVQSRPGFFKVLNLGDLASIMERSLQAAAPGGQTTVATAVLVKVGR